MNVQALRQLYSLVCTIPAREFKLNLFYDTSNGNVCGCGLGYAAVFNVCGLRICETDTLPEYTSLQGVTHRGLAAGAMAFDLSFLEALNLFSGPFRSDYDVWPQVPTHKEMWLNRIQRLFEDKGFELIVPAETQKQEAIV